MALPGDGIALRLNDPGDNSVRYDASDDRAGFTALMMAGGAGIAARAGRRPGTLTVSVGGSPETVTMPSHAGIVTDPDGGAYLYAFPSAVAKSLATRPGSGTSRIDLLVAHIYDADVHGGETTLRQINAELVTGTASASPGAPSQPSGTLLLATLTVPATGTVSVNVNGPRTVALGGILPVASQAEQDALDASGVTYDGLIIYREDTATHRARVAGAWAKIPVDTGVWHTIGATGEPTLQNGWTQDSTTKIRFRKDSAGRVSVHGFLTNFKNGLVAFTLPAGYRPPRDMGHFPQYGPGATPEPWVGVNYFANGDVMFWLDAASGATGVHVNFSFDTAT